jgi:hypothetical protein
MQSVYRRLVKKLHVVNREVKGEASAHQLPLTALLGTLTDQVRCAPPFLQGAWRGGHT